MKLLYTGMDNSKRDKADVAISIHKNGKELCRIRQALMTEL